MVDPSCTVDPYRSMLVYDCSPWAVLSWFSLHSGPLLFALLSSPCCYCPYTSPSSRSVGDIFSSFCRMDRGFLQESWDAMRSPQPIPVIAWLLSAAMCNHEIGSFTWLQGYRVGTLLELNQNSAPLTWYVGDSGFNQYLQDTV